MVPRHFQGRKEKVHLYFASILHVTLNELHTYSISWRLWGLYYPRFKQHHFYRIKTKLAEAERLVERLQEIAVQVPVDPSAAKRACCVCLLRPRNTVLIPCGHLDVCDTCAGILQTTRIEGKPEGYYLCPICRTQVLFRQIVFGL